MRRTGRIKGCGEGRKARAILWLVGCYKLGLGKTLNLVCELQVEVGFIWRKKMKGIGCR